MVRATKSNGLASDSFAMTDKVTTVPKIKLGRMIGTIGADDMALIDVAVLTFLGLTPA
jgi:mRNA interferase MazF